MSVADVPTLAQLAAKPELIDELEPAVCAAMVIEAGALVAHLGARVALAPAVTVDATPEDRLLTIAEAAAKLHIHPATMKRKLRDLPYNAAAVVLSRTCVRVSAHRLEQILLDGGLRARRKAVGA